MQKICSDNNTKLYLVTEMHLSEIEHGVTGVYNEIFSDKRDAEYMKEFIDTKPNSEVTRQFNLPPDTPKYGVHVYEIDVCTIKEI